MLWKVQVTLNSYDVLLSTTTDDIASFTVNLGTINCLNTTWLEHTINLGGIPTRAFTLPSIKLIRQPLIMDLVLMMLLFK